MLNFLGALANVARLLPNYVEGQRMAVQDNWRDLQAFNQTQMGQLENMFVERTLPWRINMAADDAARSRMMTTLAGASTIENLWGLPGRLRTVGLSNKYSPEMYQQFGESMLRQANSGGWSQSLGDFMPFFNGGMGVQQQQQQQPMGGPDDARSLMRQQTQQPTAAM